MNSVLRRVPRGAVRVASSALAALLLSCGGEGGIALVVDLRTDFVPGTEFVTVRTELSRERFDDTSGGVVRRTMEPARAASDFVEGQRVAQFSGVARGASFVRVELLDASDVVVAERTVSLQLDRSFVVTVVIARSCLGVRCPGPSDSSTATECSGGLCVDPRCTPDTPEHCAEPACTNDGECPPAGGCLRSICGAGGVCLLGRDGARCPDGQECDLDGRCISPAPDDAGSTIDAGRDAGTDAGTRDAGTSPIFYCPDLTLTRAQAAMMLVRLSHGPDYVPPPYEGLFDDVPAAHVAARHIETFARDGITTGCAARRFCPDDPLLRGQAAVFLLRVKYGASYTPPPYEGLFDDVPAAASNATFVEQLYREGISTGCAPRLFCPTDPIPRANAAVMVERTARGADFVPPPFEGIFLDVTASTPFATFIEQLWRDRLTDGCAPP